MRDASIKSYSPAFELGSPVVSSCVAKVVKSDIPDIKEGDLVVAFAPIAEYAALSKGLIAATNTRKLQNPYGLEPSLFVGALGMPGLTAWSSLYKIGQPKKGETIFVSSAAGAVGSIVGQIAKHEGLRVIGSVGSDEKAEFVLKELGFDAVTNYKKESTADALKRLAPEGIDIYYENVGGEILEAALDALKTNGRVIACGMISQYNIKDRSESYGVKNLANIVTKRITFQGFIVGDEGFGPAYYQEHQTKLQGWLHDGTFKAKVHYTEGIDNAAEGFVGMLQGKNFGKAVLKIADA
ncbi:NAD(P)-binding protein [Cryphonectria parasitica EP155]|uniref:Dehydrogenase FUB6 n=1 Tax=Cryphonectria parasitica (strain ATCC 38755 / EP155) TaxID=660469 RepID=A0A9P4XYC5_CRYP1|nr:NAD(P)-binding protein [Cryphonectria parasitica EP155]KAF3763597.1 NAD(P)-binding protein [Cryphonectria parasitica EP155]